ncbi:polycystin-2-like protein 1 [Hetaerina americana]|uniref:polycystin-2-like protein 1 n=1 Tax=Hetaerina americana TaxID=62018 RepID=UPI003A7F4A84
MAGSTKYFFAKAMSSLFLDSSFDDKGGSFREASQTWDFWNFADNVMVKSFYWDRWPSANKESDDTNREDPKILYENELLGLPRLRQLRVRSDSCDVHGDFRRTFLFCYDFYSSRSEDRNPFGPGNDTAWTYHSQSELDGSAHWGLLTNYPGGGYYQDLSRDKNSTVMIIEHLKKNNWITRATRVIFLDFAVYNANVNLFCVIKLVLEYPPTGGVIPSWSFNVVKLINYVTMFDKFILACEIFFLVFIIYYTAEEGYEMYVMRWKYFKSFWNYLDLMILTIAWVAVVFNIYRFIAVKMMLAKMLEDVNKYSNFEFLGFWQAQFNNGIAILVFFVWIKMFKFMSFNKTMADLSKTLSRSAKDVAGFAVMFMIVFFAFAQLGHLLFGTQVKGFKSLGDSSFTLLCIILGEFDFESIQSANRILGPIFFFCYVFCVFFILLNMFLAIINDTYSEVKTEISIRRQDFELMKFFHRLFNKLMQKFSKKKVDTIEEVPEGRIAHREIKENLKKFNFSDLEIEMFFAKYNLSGDGYLTEDEVNKMTADLYGNSPPGEVPTLQSNGSAGLTPEVSKEEFDMLKERMNQIEESLEFVVTKIEQVTRIMEEYTFENE